MSAKGFTFTSGSKKITLPLFSDIPVGALRVSRKATDDMDKAFLIFENVLDEKTLSVIDSLTVSELGELIAGWTAGAPVGESSES